MNLLQNIISFLKDEKNGEMMKTFFENLKNNNYDVKKTLGNFAESQPFDLLKNLFSLFNNENSSFGSSSENLNDIFSENKNNENLEKENALKPIINIADKNVLYSLTKYLAR